MTATNQSCPICGLENIPYEKDLCPQCDADLTCFKVLDSLPDQFTPPEIYKKDAAEVPVSAAPIMTEQQHSTKEKSYPNIRIMAAAFILLLTVLIISLSMFQFYRFKRLESLLHDYHSDYTGSISVMDTKLKKILEDYQENPNQGAESVTANQVKENASLPVQSSEIKADAPVKSTETAEQDLERRESEPPEENLSFRNYSAKNTDTLWDIAEKYYGSGFYYPVLLEHNPQLSIYNIGRGLDIKILNDTTLAKNIYKKKIIREGEHLYWEYTVMEGDTPQSLAMRFFKSGKIILNLDNNREMQPGEKIRIKLE